MSPESNLLITISMVGLLLVSGLWARKTRDWRMFFALAIGIAAYGVFLNRLFGFPRAPTVAMGLREDLPFFAALYICMLLGMFAQYAYRYFERPRRNRMKWDWGLLIAPVFASPIVFVPLATSFTSAGLNLETLTAARLMIFFVAFQNGFFWKDFYDLQRKEAAAHK